MRGEGQKRSYSAKQRKRIKMEKISKEDLNQTVYEKLRKVARAKTAITYGDLGTIIGIGGHDP